MPKLLLVPALLMLAAGWATAASANDVPGATTPAFKGALDVPATINVQLALANRMTAIANSGKALVAVGPRGHVLVSRDGGRSWDQRALPVSSDLVAIRFLDHQTGWAVGHDGVVLATRDAGQSWTLQFDGRQAARVVADYVAANPQLGEQQREFAQRVVEEGADKPLLDVLFSDANEGFVVGAFNTVFHTRDGGASWQPLFDRIDNPESSHIYALEKHKGQVYAAGERGLLLRWDSAQQRFTAVNSPYQGSFFGLLDTGAELIAYGLRGNVYASTDQGTSWRRISTPAPDSIVAAAALGAGRYALVSRGGHILTGSPGITRITGKSGAKPMSYASVAPVSASQLAIAGSRGIRIETISAHQQEK